VLRDATLSERYIDYIDYLSTNMILNENYFNYKAVDLVEFYNFCIKFFSIQNSHGTVMIFF
jgi:hypothetical protein